MAESPSGQAGSPSEQGEPTSGLAESPSMLAESPSMLAGSDSSTSPTRFTFDSSDLEGGVGAVEKGGERDLTSPTPATVTCPSTATHQGTGLEAVRRVQEVTRLYRERNRLARMHRKAELRVVTSLKRRKQGEAGSEEVEEGEEGGVEWAAEAAMARQALMEEDQTASAHNLQYRLLLDHASTNATNAAAQVTSQLEKVIDQLRQLVEHSFSPSPPQTHRKMMVETLLRRRQEVEEQLRQARVCYFSLVLKKQRGEEELQARQDAAQDQVSMAEMLRLVVETEAYTAQLALQESRLRAHQVSLTNIKSTINKRSQRSKELARQLHDTQAAVSTLQTQLHQEKEKLKQLSKKQESCKRKWSKIQPSARLLLDPLFARDLKEKLALREALEEELERLRHTCGRRTTSHYTPPANTSHCTPPATTSHYTPPANTSH